MTDKKTLREYRIEKGLTQIKLATLAGVGLSTVVNAEAGRQIPSIPNAEKIVTVLGIKIDEVKWEKRKDVK